MSPQEPLLVGWLAHHARARASQIALIELPDGRWFTWAQLFDRVTRLAGALRDRHGLREGDRVMLIARDSIDSFEVLLAAWRLGATFLPVRAWLGAPEVGEIVVDGSPTVIVADEEFLPLIPSAAHRILTRRPGDPTSEYECDIATADPVRGFATAALDGMNTLLYTSGTSGTPKGVIGTWRMTLAAFMANSASMGVGPETSLFAMAPQGHASALLSFPLAVLQAGGSVAVLPEWDAREALLAMADPTLGLTHVIGIPEQFAEMTACSEFGAHTFGALRYAGAGGPLPPHILAAWAAQRLPLVPIYALTEAPGCTQVDAATVAHRPEALGWSSLQSELRIARRGEASPPGVPGEVHVRGAAVTPGYWRQPETTAAAFDHGWLRTGDFGFMDASELLALVPSDPEDEGTTAATPATATAPATSDAE